MKALTPEKILILKGSDLGRTIEVFGGEAGLIIANPNGQLTVMGALLPI